MNIFLCEFDRLMRPLLDRQILQNIRQHPNLKAPVHFSEMPCSSIYRQIDRQIDYEQFFIKKQKIVTLTVKDRYIDRHRLFYLPSNTADFIQHISQVFGVYTHSMGTIYISLVHTGSWGYIFYEIPSIICYLFILILNSYIIWYLFHEIQTFILNLLAYISCPFTITFNIITLLNREHYT